MLHAAVAIPGRTDGDDVVITADEIAATGLDYLALGHWHGAQVAKTRGVTYAYAGAPEPVAVDQDKAGKVLLVTLDEQGRRRSTVDVEERSRRQDDVRAPGGRRGDDRVAARAHREAQGARRDPDLVLDVRLIGVRPDELDLDAEEVEAALKATSSGSASGTEPAGPDGGRDPARPRPSPARSSATSRAGSPTSRRRRDTPAVREAEELRDVLRLGRLLLAGREVTL